MLKIIEHPGYLGKKRDKVYAQWNELYGDKWRIAWLFEDHVFTPHIIERPEALQLYEDAYYSYFKDNPEVIKKLIMDYSDVYDTAESNIHSRFDYNIQETPNNHIHDISIRRSIMRLGYWFEGHKLLQVRGPDDKLSPHMIPYHMPYQIMMALELKDYPGKGRWWDDLGVPNSAEAFYQCNKILVVKE